MCVPEQIVAIVSHDLRNPLGAIELSVSHLVQHFGDDPDARKSLEVIRRSAARMEQSIRDLLDLASIAAGTLAIDAKLEHIEQILDEVVDGHVPLASDRGIELTRAWDRELTHLACDRARIIQLLSNLLDNALKFCATGDRVTVGATVDDTRVTIDVEDTGPGIATADHARVFDPCLPVGDPAKHGTGLGLYIAKGIVTAHRGTIELTSTSGRGARFSITLPRSR
jgi:signal transduction histidine kinase